MRFLLTLILAWSHYHILIHGEDEYCFDKVEERTRARHFTSKTAYQIIKGTNIEKQYMVPGCKPTKMWILHRHGTRLPNKKTITAAPRLNLLREEILNNYRIRLTQPINNALCREDLKGLAMWQWNTSITIDNEQFLTAQGYEDLKGTAKTYQRYYSDVLTKNYNRSYYKFVHTDTQRTTESYLAFVESLFGSNNSVKAESIPNQDLLLRPYDYCESWKAHDYTGTNSESYKYINSIIWNATMTDISKRLGFQYVLDYSDIKLMWDMCRYEQAWDIDRISVWCVVFTPEQVRILEYEDDLKYYYKLGHGYEENARLNCRLVQDMLSHLNSESAPNVVAYFGHTSGIQTFITALGVAKDNIPLTADSYNRSDRLWKTSNLDPFASNFFAVKYDCNSFVIGKEKVIFFLNQNAVDFDWCDDGLCDWSKVLKRYHKLFSTDCNNYYCANAAASSTCISMRIFSLPLIVYIIKFI